MGQFRPSHLVIALSTVAAVAGAAWLATADGALGAGFHPSHLLLFLGVVGLVVGGRRVGAERRRRVRP